MTKRKYYQDKLCICCGKKFNNSKFQTEKVYKKQKFCSLKCSYKSAKLFVPRGEKSPSWKGGVQYHSGYRYIYMPDHPYRAKELYIGEHRIIMEQHIGRFIKKGELVHHINGDRLDNRIENLYLCRNGKEHTAIHRQMDKLMFDLIKKGIVLFNEQKVQYYLKENHK